MPHLWKKQPLDASGAGLHNPIADFRLRHVQASQGAAARRWWSVLIDLHQTSLDDLQKRVEDMGFGDQLRIPEVYLPPDREIVQDSYLASILVREELLDLLNRRENDFGLAALFDGSIIASDNLVTNPQPPQTTRISVCGETAVMAVIDDGIAIAHDLFRSAPTASRVDYAAILGAVAVPGGSSAIGRALDKAQIDALLRDCLANGVLDETEFYRRSGQIDFYNQKFSPVSLRRSHGTHVTALAAGHYMADTDSAKRRLLCVSLPPRVTEDTSGQSMLPAVALALQCLLVQARRYVVEGSRKPAPVVVNFSFGNFAGPHDGTGIFARLFDQFSTESGTETARRAVVLPVGNGNLSQTHARVGFGNLHKTENKDWHLLALPDDRTATHVQFWMPVLKDHPARPVWIEISPPGQDNPARLALHDAEGPDWVLRNDKGQEIARLAWGFQPAPTSRAFATLSLAPTGSLNAATPVAPAGRWIIRLSSKAQRDVAAQDLGERAVECWVRRDETLPGFLPGGRQAAFKDRHYQRFNEYGGALPVDPEHSDALVQRQGTISGFATGLSTFVVGAVTALENRVSDYSASGPITLNPNATSRGSPPPRLGPDAMARGDDSPLLNGVLSAGSNSGSFVRLSGSSVAAPRIARILADLMVESPDFDRATFVDWVAKLPGPTLPGPRYRGGQLATVPVEVNFWDIPASALEPPLQRG